MLTVDTALLRRLYVLAFIHISNRPIEYIASTSNPDGASMVQHAICSSILMIVADNRDC